MINLSRECCDAAKQHRMPEMLLSDMPFSDNYAVQLGIAFILAIPVASIAWTVTHEEIFREPRQFCMRKSERCRTLVERKFFYLFTCEYCFSHYVTIFFLWLTRYKLLLNDWRGYILAGFAVVWIANVYMSAFGRLRLDIKREGVEIKGVEKEVDKKIEEAKQPEQRAA
jgi:hypothetical protein